MLLNRTHLQVDILESTVDIRCSTLFDLILMFTYSRYISSHWSLFWYQQNPQSQAMGIRKVETLALMEHPEADNMGWPLVKTELVPMLVNTTVRTIPRPRHHIIQDDHLHQTATHPEAHLPDTQPGQI